MFKISRNYNCFTLLRFVVCVLHMSSIRHFEDLTLYIEDSGRLLIEHGFNQRNILSDFAISKGLVVLEQIDDLSGLPRVLVLGK